LGSLTGEAARAGSDAGARNRPIAKRRTELDPQPAPAVFRCHVTDEGGTAIFGARVASLHLANPRVSRGRVHSLIALRKRARITAQRPTWRIHSCLQRRDSSRRSGGFLVKGSTRVSTRQAGVPAPRPLRSKCEAILACALTEIKGGGPTRRFYRLSKCRQDLARNCFGDACSGRLVVSPVAVGMTFVSVLASPALECHVLCMQMAVRRI